MKRVTISVPDDVAQKAQRAVEAGIEDSVSAYFAHLAENDPDWVEARAAVDELLVDVGQLPAGAGEWARRALDSDIPVDVE